MKDVNEKMLEILEDIEFEEVPLSEIELARIKKMQSEKIEKEKSRAKREKRKRLYTGIAAGFVVALGIAFFMRGGQDGESHIASEDEGGTVRITDFEGEGPREIIPGNDYEIENVEKDGSTKEDKIDDIENDIEEDTKGQDEQEKIDKEKKEEITNDVRVAEKEENKQKDEKDTPNESNGNIGTAGVDKGSIKNNGVKRTTNLQEAIQEVDFKAMVPKIKSEGLFIEEITTSNNRLTILYSYKGKVITFVTSSKNIYSYVKKSESLNIGGIDIKKGKSGLGEEYAFKKGGAYFNISTIGTLDKTFLEKFIKSIK